MPYDTWDWSKVTGTGYLSDFEAIRHDPILKNEFESGDVLTAPEDVRGIWLFKLGYSLLRPWSYVYLVDFHHSHRGGFPFYFRWPFEMAGIPPEAEIAAPGGVKPWDSEIAPGAGHGPTFLVRWMQDDFSAKRLKSRENYWQLSAPIELRQL